MPDSRLLSALYHRHSRRLLVGRILLHVRHLQAGAFSRLLHRRPVLASLPPLYNTAHDGADQYQALKDEDG